MRLARTMGGLAMAQLLTAVAMLVTASRSDPAGFGAFAALYAMSLGVGAALDFGSSALWIRELAAGRRSAGFRRWLLRRTVIQAPLVVVFGLIAVIWFGRGLSHLGVVALSLQSLAFTFCQGALSPARASDPSRAAWMPAAGNVVLVAAAIASPRPHLFTAVACAATASWLLTAVLGVKAWPRWGHDPSAGTNPWRGAGGFGLQTVAASLQSLDVAVIGAAAGRAAAGQLGAVSRWTQPIVLLGATSATHLLPAMAAAGSAREAAGKLREIWWIVVAGVTAAGAGFIGAPWLIDTLLGPKYADSVGVLRLMCVAMLPVLVSMPLTALLQARGRERIAAATSVSAVAAALVLQAVLAPSIGAAAAPIAALISQVVVLVALLRAVRHLVATTDAA